MRITFEMDGVRMSYDDNGAYGPSPYLLEDCHKNIERIRDFAMEAATTFYVYYAKEKNWSDPIHDHRRREEKCNT